MRTRADCRGKPLSRFWRQGHRPLVAGGGGFLAGCLVMQIQLVWYGAQSDAPVGVTFVSPVLGAMLAAAVCLGLTAVGSPRDVRVSVAIGAVTAVAVAAPVPWLFELAFEPTVMRAAGVVLAAVGVIAVLSFVQRAVHSWFGHDG